MKTLIPNTFGLPVMANQVSYINTPEQLLAEWQAAQKMAQPVMLLGMGSNTLFTSDFAGVVLVNQLRGISISETESDWLLHVAAGENWHQLVERTILQNIPGLENLALIPGTVGSAPIQNIGAYGVEFEKFADYVELLELATGQVHIVKEGEYGYRDSIFKHQYCDGYAVIAVGLRLSKQWQPLLAYGELQKLNPETVTAKMIYDKVCEIRRSKLPDPAILGNGGSFFKNPVVSASLAEELRQQYPAMPSYPQDDQRVKLAAGWLIDQCNLKGYQIGGAAVHQHQALVLVNNGGATAQDVIALARYIRLTVANKFKVFLEPEIRFIGKKGEIDAVALLDS